MEDKINGSTSQLSQYIFWNMVFYCKNHKNSAVESSEDKNGLGIRLIKQKLDLIYKKNYFLDILEEDNWYIVKLEIKLNED